MEYSSKDIARFWTKVDKSGQCWNWTSTSDRGGYGKINIARTTRQVHRVSYELSVGPIPPGMDIDHICRNRICVNPEHLRPATRKQNNENKSGAYSNSKSGIRGVTREKGKWRVQIGHNGKVHHVGYFENIDDAAAAATAKRNELFTHNAGDRAA